MRRWTVKLEAGVWVAPWDGDPGRTLVRGNAEQFRDRNGAAKALASARQYRPFVNAEILREDRGE